MINRKFLPIILGSFALISCSVAPKSNDNEVEAKIHFKNTSKYYSDVIVGNETDKLNYLKASNFEYLGKKVFYKGEVIKNGDYIDEDVVIVKAEVKNPVVTVAEGDKRYNDLVSVENKLDVITDDTLKIKKVTFLEENTLYVTLRNTKTNTEREIMLNVPIKVIDLPEVKNNTRYNDLKNSNDVIKYSINTYNDGLEDSLPTKDGNSVSWNKYFGFDKYEDIDDIAGLKKVTLETKINGNVVKKEEKIIDFGTKIEDYKDKFNELLTDLSNVTLKYNKDGKTIDGGFDERIIDKLKKYEKSISGKDDTLLFITEPLDNKNNVGTQKIKRKIVRNGVTIFEQVDTARVGFKGITIAIADSGFSMASPLVEERMIRYTAKGLDKEEKTDIRKLDRPHGNHVIGSAIDELAFGDSFFLNTLLKTAAVKRLLMMGMEGSEPYNFDNMINVLRTNVANAVSLPYISNDLFYERVKKLTEKLSKEEVDKIKEKENANPELTSVIRQNYFKELYSIYESFATMTEDDKLSTTDLHFRVISLDDKNGLNTGKMTRLLPRILEDDKNIRALNMSYGSELSVEEYIAIRDMSEEDKERATKEYNENINFRVAVQNWLDHIDTRFLSEYKENGPGELGVPGMLKYFKSKSTITKNDYQKLLNLRMITLKQGLKSSSELHSANEDILFVVSQGNTLANSSVTRVDLFNFDENGDKVIYLNTDQKYNNAFTSVPTYLNEVAKEKAKLEGTTFKYNPSYRKNMLGVVGLADKNLSTGSAATDNISKIWGISTSDYTKNKINKLLATENLLQTYDRLVAELEKMNLEPNKYNKNYKDEILAQVKAIENLSKLDLDFNGKPYKFSFTRAGKAKLWVVAAEGSYSYSKKLTNEEKKYNPLLTPESDIVTYYNDIATLPFIGGSSFAAPRITAISGKIGELYPFMTSNQIKQTILTTATDDMRIEEVTDESGKTSKVRLGLYGVDENIGWGISNKEKAFKGPARFVKALNSEVGEEDFIANIPYGTYEFSNDIEGAFDPLLHMVSRKALNEVDFTALYVTKDLSSDEILSSTFDTDEKTKNIAAFLKEANISKVNLLTQLRPKVDEYINNLDIEEKELFVDSGLVKKGNGTLVLSGVNTYKDPTTVEEGTLVFRGSSKSPFVVHKNAKLKLDMKYSETIEKLLNEDYVAKIEADVINAGKLYSYSTSDRITSKYTPLKDAETLIAADSTLSINELDLKETNEFNFDVFKKKGMLPFVKPDAIDEDEAYDATRDEEDSSKDFDRKDILTVEKLSKKDLYKLKLGEFEYTPFIKLIVKSEAIENDSDNVKIKAYLERNTKVKKDEEIDENNTAEALRNNLLRNLSETRNDKEKLELLLSSVDFLNKEESASLNGNILADSQVLGFEVKDLKNNIMKDWLYENNSPKIKLFTNLLSQTKFKVDKENEKNIFTNGFLVGVLKDFKHISLGGSINYTNSVIQSIKLELQPLSTELPTSTTEEEKLKIVEENKTTHKDGNAYAHNIGISGLLKFEYNNGYLNNIISVDYLNKKVARKIDNRDVKEVSSTDLLLSYNIEGGYNFNVKQFKLTPFANLDITTYFRGDFTENSLLGYKAESEVFTKVYSTIGFKFKYIADKFAIGSKVSYSKYLTDPTLKTSAELVGYEFKKNIKGIKLEDNVVNYQVDFKYNIKDNLSVNATYSGKNLRTHALNMGLKFEF